MSKLIRRLMLLVVLTTFSSAGLLANVSIQTSTYSTLKAAFDAINSGTHTGNVVVKIDSSTTETARAVLNASGTGAANYNTVTIYPTAEVSVSGSIASALVELRDADNVTIDGRINQTGTDNSLTFINNQTTSASVIWVSRVASGNGARNNTIRNTNIIGGAPQTTSVTGILVNNSSGLTTGADGNDSLKIIHNNIMRSGYGIRVIGVTTSDIVGLEIGYNTFGNNATGGDGHYYAIDFSYTEGALIEHNDISINSTTIQYHIYIRYAHEATLRYNTISNCTNTSSFYSIFFLGSSDCIAHNNVIENNTVGSSYIYNLRTNSNNNTITNETIRNHNSTGLVYSLYVIGTSTNNVIDGFTFENISGSGLSTVAAIWNSSGNDNTYKNCVVRNITGNRLVYGAYFSAAANTIFHNNIIENVTSNNSLATTFVAGLRFLSTSNGSSIVNNSISGVYANGISPTDMQYIPSGILISGSSDMEIYYNSVNMHGSNNVTTNPCVSAAFALGTTTVNGFNIRNNVFVNSMTNDDPLSKAYAVFMAGTGNLNGTTLDYNDYYVAGANGVLARIGTNDYTSIGDWRIAATNQDLNSISVNPIFNNDNMLRPYIASPLLSQGTPIAAYLQDLIGTTRSTTAPTMGAYEAAGDFQPPTILYSPLNNVTSTANRSVITVITDNQGVDTTARPRLYYKKDVNANTFNDNTNATDGWKYAEATGAGPAFTFVIDYSRLNGGIQAGNTTIEYFIIAQDIATVPNVAYTTGEFAQAPTSVALTAANFPIENIETNYSLSSAVSGTIQVGEGQTYTSLTGPGGLFELINASVVTGDVLIEITSDITETGEISLNQYAVQGGSWQVVIYPTGNHTISGNASPALIELRDADRVTIDGRINRQGDERALTLQNFAAGSAVLWLNRDNSSAANGARNNVIRYCNIIGGSATSNGTFGIVIGGAMGLLSEGEMNNNNLIEHNNIYRAYFGVRVLGGSSERVNNTQIKNNLFGNNATSGDGHYYPIYNYYSDNAVIEGNTINLSNTTVAYCIYNYYADGSVIENNLITGSFSSTFYGIFDAYSSNSIVKDNVLSYISSSINYTIRSNYTTNSLYDNNIVSNISASSTFYLIYASYGGENTITNNQIIDNTGTGTGYAIWIGYERLGVIENNIIRNFEVGSNAYAIYGIGSAASPADSMIIRNNIIDGIYKTGTSATMFPVGIYLFNFTQGTQIINNSISGIFDAANKTNNLYIPAGIRIRNTQGIKIWHNSVNLYGTDYSSNNAVGYTAGILLYDANANTLDIRNNVFSNTMEDVTGSKAFAIYIVNTGSLQGTVLDNNNYYVTGTQGVLGYLAADMATLADWRTASGGDMSSIAVNPIFNSNRELLPFNGSPLQAAGAGIADVPTDIKGITRSLTAPTIGAYEQVGDYIPPTIDVELLANAASTINRELTAQIEDRSGVNDQAFKPRLYFKKKTNANTFVDNTAATDGWKFTEATGTAPTFSFTLNTALIHGGLTTFDEIEYFVVAQDSAASMNVGVSSGSFATMPDDVHLVAANFPVANVSHFYQILPALSGTIQVGLGQQFTSLTGPNGAFDYLNKGVLVGDLFVELTSDLQEQGTIPLQQIDSYGAGAPYTIYIYPTTEVFIVDESSTALIILNDADNVTIDGRINRQGTTNSLNLENTNTPGACIWVQSGNSAMDDGANNVTIRNVNIIGSAMGTSTSYGILVGGQNSFTTAGANHNFRAFYNDISKCYYGIRVFGSSAQSPENPQIRFNTFGNNATPNEGHFYPIDVYYATEALISNNTISVSSSTSVYAIRLWYGNNSIVHSNNIGSGSSTIFYGIYDYYGSENHIFNNTIEGWNSSSSTYYYYTNYGTNVVFEDNTVKNSGSSSIMYMLYANQGNNNSFINNLCENISSSINYGIRVATCANAIVHNNTLRNMFPSGTFYGIYPSSSNGTEIIGNKIENLPGGSGIVYGIYISASTNMLVNNNYISDLVASTTIAGIYNLAADNTFVGNTIQNLYQSSGLSTSHAVGIYTTGANTFIANNEISGIYDTFNTTSVIYIPAGIRIHGNGGHKIYYNSVNMHGTSQATNPTTAGASAALLLHSVTSINNLDIRNNVFVNTKVGTTANSKSYAIYIANTGNMTNTTIDYNDYHVSGANGVLGYLAADQTTLAQLRLATNQDVNSISVDPLFNNNQNLRPYDGSPIVLTGTPLTDVTTDKIGVARHATQPTIGAYEEVGDFDPPAIAFTPLPNTDQLTNRLLSAEITDLSGVNSTTNPPRIYYRKLSNENAFYDNTPGTEGWKYTVASGSGSNYTFTIDHGLLFGGLTQGNKIEYFIVAQDNSPIGYAGASSGEFMADITSTTLSAIHFPVNNVQHQYTISIPFAGIVNVGQGQIFTSLTDDDGLFEALSDGLLVGNLQIRITSNLIESGKHPLAEVMTEGGMPYTISIYPTGNYTISGMAPGGLIELRDADRVTIDGRINRQGTTNSLTIENTATTSSAVIRLSKVATGDGARNITLRNLNIIGGAPQTTTVHGIIASSATSLTAGATGFDSLNIIYNNIMRAGYGIRIIGLAAQYSTGLEIRHNKLGNFGTSGDGHYYGIDFSYTNGALIEHNEISITSTTIQYHIHHRYAQNAISRYNRIYNSSNSSSFYAMYFLGAQNCYVHDNIVENISASFSYIWYVTTSSSGNQFVDNTIRNYTSTGLIYALYVLGTSTNNTFDGMTLENITSSGTSTVGGIYSTSGQNNTYENFVIRNITGNALVYGAYFTNSANSSLRNSTIENITSNNSLATQSAFGVYLSATSTGFTIANNTIRGIFDNGTGSNDPRYVPSGILIFNTGSVDMYYNTIELYGSQASSGTAYSAGINLAQAAVTNCNIRNNVLINNVTSNITASRSYAILFSGTANSTGATIDYNNYYVTGANGHIGGIGGSDYTALADWQVASTQDQNSISANPLFVGGNDLRPLNISPLLGAGTPILNISTDKLGANRSLVAPTIGAYEDGVLIGVPNLVSPANLATNTDVNIGLMWDSVFTATGYVLQVSTNISFSTFLFNGPVTGTGQAMMGLMYNSTYYWRVKAVRGTDEGNWSDVWQFTTMPPPLLAPALVSPADLAIDVALNPTMSWNSVFSATGYNVQLSTDSTFATTILNETQTTTTIDVSGLDYSTEYFWRVRALRNTEQGPWSNARMFTTIPIPPLTVPVLASPADASTNVPLDVTLNWNAVGTATAYVMNFSTDNTFATILHEDTLTTTSYDIAALTVSTEYFWRVRALRGTEESNWSSVWSFETTSGSITQTIPLTSGWNMFSANVTPQNPAMSNILTPLLGNMMLIKNVYGQVFAPPFQASLTNWNTSHAYQARMTTPANLVIEGAPIVPEMTPLTLDQLGWYWLPYYRTSSMPVGNALATIQGKYLQIKSITGQVHQPPFITTLQNLEPNMGYMIRMTATDGTLTYPSNAIIKAGSEPVHIPQPKVFVRDAAVTGKTAVIALELDNMQNGDEVGVFTRDGLLVGSSVWANGSRGVVVWGDDEYTNEKDGAAEGEELIVKIWSAEANNIGKVESISLNDMTTNARQFTLTYETDAVYLLKGTADVDDASTMTVSPQPASSEVYVRMNISSENAVQIRLFNQAGQVALSSEEMLTGGLLRLNTSNLPSGVYQLMITADGKTYSEKVVIVK